MSENHPGLIYDTISPIAVIIFSILAWVFKKPNEEEARIGRLRKSLLTNFRFKISVEVAKVLPVKSTRKTKDEYVATCQNNLIEYFSANSELLLDFLGCEQLHKSYIRCFRNLKYGVIIIPIIGVIFFIISMVFFKNDVSSFYYVGVSIFLVLLIIFLWISMERKKDKYHDLCSKYEVIDDYSDRKDK